MKIYAKSKHHFDGREEYNNQLPLPSQVKRLGQYLKKNLTGVYKVEEPPNAYNIRTIILYQIPPDLRKKMKEYNQELKGVEEDIYEAKIYLGITTYNKQYIRLHIILLNDMEPTLGFIRFDREDLMSLPYCKQKLLDYTYEKITDYFRKYEVLI